MMVIAQYYFRAVTMTAICQPIQFAMTKMTMICIILLTMLTILTIIITILTTTPSLPLKPTELCGLICKYTDTIYIYSLFT